MGIPNEYSNPFESNSFDANPFESYSFKSNPFETNSFDVNSISQNRPSVYQLHDDKWVFIEEAKKLQQIIKDFSNHPVTPQKLYWQRKYNKDKEAYIARSKESQNTLSQEAFESAGIDTTQCEEEKKIRLADIKEEKRKRLQECDNQ